MPGDLHSADTPPGDAALGAALERLAARVDTLERETAVFRGCLEEAGLLSHEWKSVAPVPARVLVRKSPLLEVLLARELRAPIASCSGWPAVRALGSVSRSLRDICSLVPAVLCVYGGADGPQFQQSVLQSVEQSSPAGGSWATNQAMRSKRWGPAGAVLEGSVYVCGGHDGQQSLASVERLDPFTGEWSPAPPLALKRAGAAAAVLGGALYVCGGHDGLHVFGQVERLQLGRGAWESVSPLAQARAGSAASVLGGRILVCGGNDSVQVLSSVEGFSCAGGDALGSWEDMPAMAQRRGLPASAVSGGRLYICGGHDDGTQVFSSVEVFSLQTGTWELLPPMSVRRCGAAAAVLNGRLYVFGGRNPEQRVLSTAESFDPASSVWQPAASLKTARVCAGAVAMLAPL